MSRSWWLLACWIALIFIMSSQSHPWVNIDLLLGLKAVMVQLHGYDKLVHATVWAVLTFFLWQATSNFSYASLLQQSSFIMAVALLLGGFDELHQYFIPGRTSSLLDLAADSLGCAIMISCLCLYKVLYLNPAMVRAYSV